ncbi:hypothetical protein D3C81_854530 [compost metagenome]
MAVIGLGHADHQPPMRAQHARHALQQRCLGVGGEVLQHVQEGHAAVVFRHGGEQVDALEMGLCQCRTLGGEAPAPDLGVIVVHAPVGHVLAIAAQRMRQQAEPAAHVEQRRAAATQGLQHARVERIAAQFEQGVEVVTTVAPGPLRGEGAGDGTRIIGRHGRMLGAAVHSSAGACSSCTATGSACSTQRRYISAEGCRPSSTSIAGLAPSSRLVAVISTKATL